ncbi:CHAP domain-containing protein [Nonomuraea sp. WAC 01424]|uniref:CHAP domain-containing protein n=1 Tax=Nonomuraea sp. WAC 01424 TaxID=2203200 RepID=UPI000F7A0894|nr:CHAP domain-containing protein [Nonomuraea sp. WAC 01424]RSN05176.1 CHAP domain-containing protein [Nonomuraea sp. WAC 01424]
MAIHRLSRAPKINYARAPLGVTVIASALGAHATAASADTTDPAAASAQAAVAPEAATQARIPTETQVNVTAAQVLAMAKAQVGTSENAYGGGTKFQKWYADSQRADETVARDGGSRQDYINAPWCSMFVSWVGEETGARPQVGWDAWTVAHAKWFAANKRWGSQAKPGAVVFFSWSGSKNLGAIQHVGFVVKDNHDGTISTIEGNTGNGKVEERVRPKSQVVGYGYPQYAG